MLIPSQIALCDVIVSSLSRRVNANSQLLLAHVSPLYKLIKKGEC